MESVIVEQGIVEDDNFRNHLIELISDSNIIECRALIAFVSLNGLMQIGASEDGELYRFMNRADTHLHWIVGADQITTHHALHALRDLIQQTTTRHTVQVFLSRGRQLFHPKVYIFKRIDGTGAVLVGSNNLTPGGLSGNYEVSVRLDNLSSDELHLWMSLWTRVSGLQENLHQIDDELLSNIQQMRQRDRPPRRRERTPVLKQDTSSFGEILIREIPRAGTRTTQVHFTRRIMERYFGFTVGQSQEARFQQFESEALAEVEQRPLVYSQTNRNPRIELSGARRIADNYPTDGRRPLIVFERIARGMYRYLSLLPDEDGFQELSDYLGTIPQPRNSLRFGILEQDDLLEIWPDYPM